MENNVDILKALKQDYSDGLVSALIGSGFSKNAYRSYPDWKELMKDVIVYLHNDELRGSRDRYSTHFVFGASMYNLRFSGFVMAETKRRINIIAMSRGVNLKDMPILESLGYVFVPLLSYIVLKEKITKRTIVSIVLILIGIVWFYQ